MGNAQSEVPKEGEGHPALFYKGVAAAGEARFSLSEFYFAQALQKHPGHEFWDTLMQAVFRAPGEALPLPPPSRVESERGDRRWRSVLPVEEPDLISSAFGASASDVDRVRDSSAPRRASQQDGSDAEPRQRAHLDPGCVEHAGKSNAGSQARGRRSASRMSSESAAFAYTRRAIDVPLPLDGRLQETLDFYRLLADIALTYLELLPTTRHKEKVLGLAGRYCLFTISHTHVLLHCLRQWKEEHFESGGGFIDYEKKRDVKFAASPPAAEDEDAVTFSGRGTLHASHREHRTHAAAMLTLAMAESNCRYFFLSFACNYGSLLLLATATVTDRRRRHLVLANALEHVEAAYAKICEALREYPNEYNAQVLLAFAPQPTSSATEEWPKSASVTSNENTYRSLVFNAEDTHHIYGCGVPWSFLQSALVPRALAAKARLVVDESAGRRAVVTLRTPAERMSYHYLRWQAVTEFMPVPGCSPYMLERALPSFRPGRALAVHDTPMRGSSETEVESSIADTAPGDASVPRVPSALAAFVPGAQQHRLDPGSAEYKALLKRARETLRKCGRVMNTNLDLSDERTCVMLCGHELAIMAIPQLLHSAKVKKLYGSAEEAKRLLDAVVGIVAGLEGPDSAELFVVRHGLESGLSD